MLDTVKIAEYYRQNKSTREIAKIFNTYPNKIVRILKDAGVQIRNRSESTKLAIEEGKIKPPMLGKKRTQKEKEHISQSQAKKWKSMSEEDREKIRKTAKDRWNDKTEDEKKDMQQKAGEALRKACTEGSKLEKYLNEHLTLAGFNVIMHKKGLIPGDKYEIDLWLPDIPAAIEVDGPQHFMPFYGEAELRTSIRYDSTKNGILMNKGVCVIRMKYLCKHNSNHINKEAFLAVKKVLEDIKKEFPPLGKRLIQLEVGGEND